MLTRGPMTTAAMAEELRITPDLVRVALRRLKAERKVIRVLSDAGESMWSRPSGS